MYLYISGRRKTILTEVVPGKIWTLDQVCLYIYMDMYSYIHIC
jgi:hypothetical protein